MLLYILTNKLQTIPRQFKRLKCNFHPWIIVNLYLHVFINYPIQHLDCKIENNEREVVQVVTINYFEFLFDSTGWRA